MTQATGVGSWPGTNVREALRAVRDLLGALDDDGVTGLPYLPELPARGPGGDLVGRGAGLLVELPVDVQPAGWRLVDRPGRDVARTLAFWRQDLDELAETFEGYAGPLKLQAADPGPWPPRSGWRGGSAPSSTRAPAGTSSSRSPRECADSSPTCSGSSQGRSSCCSWTSRPCQQSLRAGSRPPPGSAGSSAVDPQVVASGLRAVLAEAGDRHTLVHCCAASVPIRLLRDCGAAGISVDTSLLTPRGWEGLAVAVEEGLTVYAGCVPTARPARRASR